MLDEVTLSQERRGLFARYRYFRCFNSTTLIITFIFILPKSFELKHPLIFVSNKSVLWISGLTLISPKWKNSNSNKLIRKIIRIQKFKNIFLLIIFLNIYSLTQKAWLSLVEWYINLCRATSLHHLSSHIGDASTTHGCSRHILFSGPLLNTFF